MQLDTTWWNDLLVCPRDHQPLQARAGFVTCADGHQYPVIDGIPVMLLDDVEQTIDVAAKSIAAAREAAAHPRDRSDLFVDTLGIAEHEKQGVLELAQRGSSVDPVVAYMVGATNGILYIRAIGALRHYPIPELRLPDGHGATLLDVGCNWGRWSIAAARKGYRVVGIDPSLGAVLAARRVCEQMGLDAHFCVADGRSLPFRRQSFDVAFSYSVLQHMAVEHVEEVLLQLHAALRPGGTALIQMPNRLGVRCLYHQVRRRFRKPRAFEVRYWSIASLVDTFESALGPTTVSVDCYFGLGLQASDAALMPPLGRAALLASEGLRHASGSIPALCHVADSVYLSAQNRADAA